MVLLCTIEPCWVGSLGFRHFAYKGGYMPRTTLHCTTMLSQVLICTDVVDLGSENRTVIFWCGPGINTREPSSLAARQRSRWPTKPISYST